MLNGIDISAWQGNPALREVAAAGYRFAILKATEGLSYVSPRFAPEWADGGDSGLRRGVYHFARYELDPERQAGFFCREVDKVLDGDFPEIVHAWDFEPYDDWATRIQPAVAVEHCLRGLRRLEADLGAKPMLYVPDWYFYMLLKGYHRRGLKAAPQAMELAEYPLWLCDYSPAPREMPWPLTKWGTPWTIWQKSGSGTVPGVKGDCDLNVFAGDEHDLSSLIAGGL